MSNVVNKVRFGRPANLLIMGDPHATPEYDNSRFKLAGYFAGIKDVDAVVCLGDWGDMPSLSDYDRKKKSFEGRRYKKDIAAIHESLQLFDEGFDMGRDEIGSTRPTRFFLCGGNHDEDRIGRMVNNNPELDEMISIADMKYEEFGWEYTPFKDAIDINGMVFSHFFASGVMGRPIGGERPALSLINKLHQSACCGHNHLFDRAHRTRPDGSRVVGISAGWFGNLNHKEGWNRNTAHLYWNGLLIAKDMYKGDCRLEEFSQQELWRDYGSRSKSK